MQCTKLLFSAEKKNLFIYLKYLPTSDNTSSMRHNVWAGQQGSKNGH